MKTRLLITHLFLVTACLAIFFVFYPAYAIPWISEENKALDADAIAVGQIVSYSDDGAHRYYEISIIKWIKNPQLDQTITMRSITPKVFDPHVPYEIFEKKDLGLFYIKLIDGEWRSTNYSKQIFASEQSQTIYNMKKLVGNNNPDSSVSLERICKEGHVNAVKNRTGEIYCVKRESLEKLRERGWTLTELKPELEPEDKSNVMKKARELGIDNIMEAVDSETIFDIDSPLKQIKSGITIDEIKCKNGLVIVAKLINNSPACVKPETKAKLIERGWTDNITKHDVYFLTVNGGYDIPYSISGAILSSITADIDKSELVIKLDNSTDGGNLIITLPRTLIDRKIGNDDGDFIVMINNMTINFKETRDEFFRTLEIPFVKGIETISIASPHNVS